jgi:hypothetical protein
MSASTPRTSYSVVSDIAAPPSTAILNMPRNAGQVNVEAVVAKQCGMLPVQNPGTIGYRVAEDNVMSS